MKSKIYIFIKDRGEQGASIEEIDKVLQEYIPRRTLQRRLGEMQQESWILAKGEARATRYYAKTAAETAVDDNREDRSPLTSPTKNPGQPVEHLRKFLDNYEPQITNYLSKEDKENLAAPGKTDNPGQPGASFAKQILPRFLADFSYNSCRLEANPYSLREVQHLVKSGEPAADKTFKETQMILNHKQAIEFIVFTEPEPVVTRQLLTNLHAIVSDNLLPDPASYGRLRSAPLKLERSAYLPPSNPGLISEMFEMILEKANRIEDPFEQSFFLMVQLSYLQPFENVNHQLSRIVMNIPFMKNNLSPVSFAGVTVDQYNKGLSELYEFNRFELLRNIFLAAYKRSAQIYADFQLPPEDPALIKIKYRDQFRRLVSQVVRSALTPEQASVFIHENSLGIAEHDRGKFIAIVHTELGCLHEGNVGRFWIRPEEFNRWKSQQENNPES